MLSPLPKPSLDASAAVRSHVSNRRVPGIWVPGVGKAYGVLVLGPSGLLLCDPKPLTVVKGSRVVPVRSYP